MNSPSRQVKREPGRITVTVGENGTSRTYVIKTLTRAGGKRHEELVNTEITNAEKQKATPATGNK